METIISGHIYAIYHKERVPHCFQYYTKTHHGAEALKKVAEKHHYVLLKGECPKPHGKVIQTWFRRGIHTREFGNGASQGLPIDMDTLELESIHTWVGNKTICQTVSGTPEVIKMMRAQAKKHDFKAEDGPCTPLGKYC